MPRDKAAGVLILVHGRGGSAEDILSLAEAIGRSDLAVIAPQAAGHTWHPQSFMAPVEANEPGRSSGLSVLESITEGNGMPGYTEAVAEYFPDTNWAHYSTLYDGGGGGQTGFYNVMLNPGDPISAQLFWWEASWRASCSSRCSLALSQSE